MPCMACDRDPYCRECHGSGEMAIDQCPRAMITADIPLAIEAWRRRQNGEGWPVAGGWLDQTRILLDAMDVVALEDARIEAQRKTE